MSGAMDSFGARARVMAALDRAIERAQKSQRDAETGQHGLFGIFDAEPDVAKKADDDEFR